MWADSDVFYEAADRIGQQTRSRFDGWSRFNNFGSFHGLVTKLKMAATSHNPWAELKVRNLNCVVVAGVQPADQRWGFWPLLPLSY